MRNNLIALVCVSLFAAACGNAGIPNPTTADDESTPSEAAKAKAAKAKLDDDLSFLDEQPEMDGTEAAPAPVAQRQVGDVAVHRFSGSFTKKPITLTEEVTARAGSLVIVDYTFEQGKFHEKLRVTHDASGDRVLRVREVRGNKEFPSSVSAFEAMMSKTVFVPDANEEELGSEKTTCLIGSESVDCEKHNYRVKIGNQVATLSLSQGKDGKDISGEITAQDGKVFYKAELIGKRAGAQDNVASR